MKFYAFNKVHFVGIVPRVPNKEDEDFLYEAMVDLEGTYIPEFKENILNYTLVPEDEVLEYIRDNVFDKYIVYRGCLTIRDYYIVKNNVLVDNGDDLQELTTKELLEAIYVSKDIKVYKEVEL